MKKQYLKSTGRLFSKHIVRLLSITAIFIVSVGLMSGLGNVKRNVKGYLDDLYHTANVHDIEIVGANEEHLKKIEDNKDYLGVDKIQAVPFLTDIPNLDNTDYATRYNFFDFEKHTIDLITAVEGRLPENDKEIVALYSDENSEIVKHKVNDIVHFDGYAIKKGDYKIVGLVRSPIQYAKGKEPSNWLNDWNDKSSYRYVNDTYFIPSSAAVSNESKKITLTLKDRGIFNYYSKNYVNTAKDLKVKVTSMIQSFNPDQVLTLEECFCIGGVASYADKVGILVFIFLIFFGAITLLVTYSTMSRLLDEERGSMAVLKTLGYSNAAIAIRYIIFAAVAGIVGSLIALGPAYLVNSMIVNGFRMQFALTYLRIPVFSVMFAICSSSVIVGSLIAITISAVKKAKNKPVELLTPKAPKVGKKILLERTKKIWNKLSFKYKSTFRNVFLFKARFWMTFISIVCSTMLIFASFSLIDNSFKMDIPGIQPLRIISGVLLLFSGLLCSLVVYNITNINVSERTREIATLMVLGYRKKEVAGYIYREIYIMTIIGAVVGLPCGVAFTDFVFKYMNNFGRLQDTNWWTYILTPLITFMFAFLATRLLYRKIINTDMNDSLKVLE